MNSAWIFHEPVDPIKLEIPDYIDVIKHPMDFGTIKNKLNTNQYPSNSEGLLEFIHDM
jgi:hypothetical protein